MALEAVLFDFDGVLGDTEPVHFRAWRSVLEPEGIELGWEYYVSDCIGVSDQNMLKNLAGLAMPPRQPHELFELYPMKKKAFRERIASVSVISDELSAELKRLDAMPMAVVSSSFGGEVRPILEREGVMPYFDALVFGDDVANHKPHPEPYLKAKQLLGVEHALVLEDSNAGVASGTAAGCEVVRVSDPREVPGILRHYFK